MSESKCPNHQTQLNKAATANNAQWWLVSLNLRSLQQYGANVPTNDLFDYKKAFSTLNLDDVKADINKAMTTAQSWWPADYDLHSCIMGHSLFG
jgi:catalase-peroxidase